MNVFFFKSRVILKYVTVPFYINISDTSLQFHVMENPCKFKNLSSVITTINGVMIVFTQDTDKPTQRKTNVLTLIPAVDG